MMNLFANQQHTHLLLVLLQMLPLILTHPQETKGAQEESPNQFHPSRTDLLMDTKALSRRQDQGQLKFEDTFEHDLNLDLDQYVEDDIQPHRRVGRSQSDKESPDYVYFYDYDTDDSSTTPAPVTDDPSKYTGLAKDSVELNEECGVDRDCFEIMSKSLTCRDSKCQCVKWNGTEMRWNEDKNKCLGVGGHRCVTNEMCHSGKCVKSSKDKETGNNHYCSEAGHAKISSKELIICVELMVNIGVMIIARLLIVVY